MKKHFRPKCLTSHTHIAVNNRNELLPCCFWDTTPMRKGDPEETELMKASDINKFDSIADILKQKVWVDFYNKIKEADETQNIDKVTHLCRQQCLDKGESKFRLEEWYDSKGNLINKIEK
jgi:hypothetical protein